MWRLLRTELTEMLWLALILGMILSLSVGLGAAVAAVV
jgi:hypothetical protein